MTPNSAAGRVQCRHVFRRQRKRRRTRQVRELVRVAEGNGSRILDWHIFGQPGIDRLRASLQVAPKDLASLVDSVLKVDKLRINWKIFPKGIPVIDHFQVEIENAGTERF